MALKYTLRRWSSGYESKDYRTILEMPSMMRKNGRERFI